MQDDCISRSRLSVPFAARCANGMGTFRGSRKEASRALCGRAFKASARLKVQFANIDVSPRERRFGHVLI